MALGLVARGCGSTGAEVGARTLSDDLIKAQQRMVGKMDIDPTGKRLDSTFAGFVTHTLVGNLLEHLTVTGEDGEQVRDDRKASVLQNITTAVADRYWRRCEELDLAPPVNSSGLPDRTEMSDVPHFDAYVYAAFQVAQGVLAGPEQQTRMALFMKRMGVRLFDAMCSIMAKSPSSNNTSLKELRSRLKLLLDKMKEIRLIRSYNVVWTPNAGKLWDQGQPVGFVLELQEPAYQLGAKQLLQEHALDPAIVQHILLSHFTAYQVDAERRVLQVGRPGEPDVKEAWLLMPW